MYPARVLVAAVVSYILIAGIGVASPMRGDSLAGLRFGSDRDGAYSLYSKESHKGSASAPWDDCDFGGELPTPVLAYNFNSVDRTTSFLGNVTVRYHESSSEAASISPTANHEIQCNVVSAPPYCGTFNATGGPDGTGLPGSAYYDLSTGDGTAHRGFLKAVDAAEENYFTDDELTISVFIKMDGKSAVATYLVAKSLEFYFMGNPNPYGTPYDTALCADIYAASDSTNCGWTTGTDMADYSANGVWEHWVFAYDGASYKIYKDGGLRYTQTGVGDRITNTDNKLSIGAANTWGFDGGIDEVSIFSEALDVSQIRILSHCVIPD